MGKEITQWRTQKLLVDPVKGSLKQGVDRLEDACIITHIPSTHAPFSCVCGGCYRDSFKHTDQKTKCGVPHCSGGDHIFA